GGGGFVFRGKRGIPGIRLGLSDDSEWREKRGGFATAGARRLRLRGDDRRRSERSGGEGRFGFVYRFRTLRGPGSGEKGGGPFYRFAGGIAGIAGDDRRTAGDRGPLSG